MYKRENEKELNKVEDSIREKEELERGDKVDTCWCSLIVCILCVV